MLKRFLALGLVSGLAGLTACSPAAFQAAPAVTATAVTKATVPAAAPASPAAKSVASPPPAGSPAPVRPAASPSPAATKAALKSLSEIGRAPADQTELILATTTSTQDSGLLDLLVPRFEKATGYQVKTIAVGTGQSLALGARGEADVVLVHAPDAEKTWFAEGNGTERTLVMHNDFILIGPPNDPAKIKGETSAEAAVRKIGQAGTAFISRGDNSGTHLQELAIWKVSGVEPKGQTWYQESGQGMGATLTIANEKRAYTLTDRATYLARQNTLQLTLQVEGSLVLLNIYHVMPVNPQKFPKVNAAAGKAFADFLVTREAQATIADFGKDKYGQALFFPDAGKADSEIGR